MASPLPLNLPPGYLEADKSYQVIGVAISFIVVNILATVLRTCARHLQKTRWMWSDFLMPISLVFNLGVCTCALLGARWGAGKHTLAVPQEDIIPFTLLNYYGIATIYLFAVTFSKLAILDLYLHIFIDKLSRYTTYSIGLIVILSLIANFITVLTQCRPVSFLWDPTGDGFCHDIQAHFTWASLPNIITDLVMLILPIPVIIKLYASWRVKVGILITFLVGSLGMVTSIVRFVQFHNYGWENGFSDPHWFSNVILSWTVVEPGTYHLAACFVTLRPLFGWLFYESPLSSFLSRSHLISGSRSTSNEPSGTHKKLPDHSRASHMDGGSDRNTFIYHGNGFTESSATADDEVYGLSDVGVARNIHIKQDFAVSKA